jgi:hypothetical protein
MNAHLRVIQTLVSNNRIAELVTSRKTGPWVWLPSDLSQPNGAMLQMQCLMGPLFMYTEYRLGNSYFEDPNNITRAQVKLFFFKASDLKFEILFPPGF